MVKKSQANPALVSLRRATAAQHSAIERMINLDALLRLPIDLSRYCRLLQTHLHVHQQIADFLPRLQPTSFLPFWTNTEQMSALQADLATLNCSGVVNPPAVQGADCAASALGWVYVVEGASHGNVQILATLKRDNSLAAKDCNRYLALGAKRLRENWPALLAALAQLDESEIDAAVAGARQGFQHFADGWQALA